jgi:hypothetical protein
LWTRIFGAGDLFSVKSHADKLIVTRVPAPGFDLPAVEVFRHQPIAPCNSNLKHPRQLIYRHTLTGPHLLSHNCLSDMRVDTKPDHFHVYITQSIHARSVDGKFPRL